MNKKYDYLIVGSGLYGATFAHCATKMGKRCIVIEKRPCLGGNIYCDEIEGINVHKYGAHIFHTNNEKVWKFVNTIVPFNNYINSPLANYKGILYNLPFNMNTFYQMWGVTTPADAELKIKEQRLKIVEKLNGRQPENLEEQALLLVGEDIYEKLIEGYTEKQWGRKCSELPAFIIKRLPLRFIFNNNYFNDQYQGIPIGGYNKLINGLLKNIETSVNTDFFENRESWQTIADKIVFTGKIDEYFDYQYGKLEYRTVYFENELLHTSNYQGNAVINYTGKEIPYTRIIEHKHFEMFDQDVYNTLKTFISREFSVEWKDGMEPFYPINDARNSALYAKYKEMADKEEQVIFGGRLAEYKYYDMAPIIEQVLSQFGYLSE